MPNDPTTPRKSTPLGAALVALVGLPAAIALFVATPAEESGRTVEARPTADGGIAVRHVSGPQYLRAYRDIVGVWTGCDGIAYVQPGQTFTEEQCARLLEAQLVIHAAAVLDCTPSLKAAGREQQRIAATLLAYNIGPRAYCRSTVDRRFDAGNIAGACDAFLMWNKAGGRVVRGLDNRRRRERVICLTGV